MNNGQTICFHSLCSTNNGNRSACDRNFLRILSWFWSLLFYKQSLLRKQTFTLQLNTQLLSGQERHSGLNAGIWLAVEEVNADPTLPNVYVNTTNYYSWDGVNSATRLSVNAFMQSTVLNAPGNVLIGPPLSGQAVPMAAIAESFDIPVVSYLATAPPLSDKSRFSFPRISEESELL
jgi:hypothetical protein